MAKAKQTFYFTAALPVLFSRCDKMDEGYLNPKSGTRGKPKFSITLKPTEEQLAAYTKGLLALFPGHKFDVKEPKIGVSVSKKTGNVTIKAQSVYKPLVVDAKNNTLVDPKIGEDSIVRLQVRCWAHEEGVGIVLQQVQIVKLVEWASSGRSSAFDAVDGYESEEGDRGFPDDTTGKASAESTSSSDADALDI